MQQFLHSMKHYAIFFAVIAALTYVLTLVLGADKVDLDKIGRASCRERV